ncbi:MAG: hypothetical protein JSU85_08305 [Candidatus Zixiibacteriota bacterium]|nr:MAG: hypothetical protein JSU85_08305 [candidate division Zixibacteria bacterium]
MIKLYIFILLILMIVISNVYSDDRAVEDFLPIGLTDEKLLCLDETYNVAHFKNGLELTPCPHCPPVR